jgi:hypothetical protein
MSSGAWSLYLARGGERLEITDEVLKLAKESAVNEKNIKLLILVTILEELRGVKTLLEEMKQDEYRGSNQKIFRGQ